MSYFGPFPSVHALVKLQLPPSAQIHPMFQVSVLKKCEGHPQLACVPKPLLLNKKDSPLQPQVILYNRRMIKKNDKWQEEVLIKWHGLFAEEIT